jgi:hypothetical protein
VLLLGCFFCPDDDELMESVVAVAFKAGGDAVLAKSSE